MAEKPNFELKTKDKFVFTQAIQENQDRLYSSPSLPRITDSQTSDVYQLSIAENDFHEADRSIGGGQHLRKPKRGSVYIRRDVRSSSSTSRSNLKSQPSRTYDSQNTE